MIDIKKLKEGQIDVILVIGEVDASSSILLDNAIKETIEQGAKKIIVDCTSLEYISSAGLGVFMSYIDELKKKRIKFVVTGLNQKVYHVFEILGLDQLLTITTTKNDGLKYLK